MKADEIKEILDGVKLEVNSTKSWIEPVGLNRETWNKLLDYITNLQQELEEYKDTETYSKRFLYKANKDRLNANLDLVKENEKLNKENEKWWAVIKDNEQEIKDLCLENSKLEQENERLKELDENYPIEEELAEAYRREEDYKSRIEKANEFIIENTELEHDGDDYGYMEWINIINMDTMTFINNLSEILNGRSDE